MPAPTSAGAMPAATTAVSSAPPRETIVADSAPELAAALRNYIGNIVRRALTIPGIVSIGVSGGSMVQLLAGVLPTIQNINWKRVRFFMVDERMCPHTHSDSNYGRYVELLPPAFHPFILPVDMVEHAFKSEKNPYDVSRTALQYELTLKMQIGPEVIGRLPRFDIILLGIGPDGHTASIFPNGKLWKLQMESYSWLMAVEDSPKPPPKRVTITMPVINQAKNVAFIITGEEKAIVVKGILDRDVQLPASHVKPMYGTLKFFLDSGAASKLDPSTVVRASTLINSDTAPNRIPSPPGADVQMDVS